ncbi:hypothetical protein ACHAQJ_008340 [Trichoderma viride]
MPLVSLSNLCSLLSFSQSASDTSSITAKEQPTLRVCFPLRIQRGPDVWWEYEEYQIRFQDRLMWRQAFGLDAGSLGDTSSCDHGDSSPNPSATKCDEKSRPDDEAFESRWSHSTSSETIRASGQGCYKKNIFSESSLPSGSSQTAYLTSEPLYSLERYRSHRPPPLDSLHKQQLESPIGGSEEIQHHRDVTLQKLEGKHIGKTKDRFLSAFKNVFRHRVPSTKPTWPASPQQPPPPQGQKTNYNPPPQEWAKLRDIILSGLAGNTQRAIPVYTEEQEAIYLPVEQRQDSFKVQMRHPGKATALSDVKAALERIEARNWEDVVFIRYEDTPREMKRWYTTKQPRVLQWGSHMI